MSKETEYQLREGDKVVIEIECSRKHGFAICVTKNKELIANLETRDLDTVKVLSLIHI